MGRSTPESRFAREYGLNRRDVHRIGLDRLMDMDPSARAVLLNGRYPPMASRDLRKGGLAKRGFTSREKGQRTA